MKPRFLLDKGLNPKIAEALSLCDYDFISVDKAFGTKPTDSVKDPEIIEYCAREGRTWVNKDRSAQRDHGTQLQTRWVSVVYLPNRELGTKEQLRLIVRHLQFIEQILNDHPEMAYHWMVSSGKDSTVKELWRSRRPRPVT